VNIGKLVVSVLMVMLVTGIGIAQEEDDFTPGPELVVFLERLEQVTSEIRGLEAKETVTRFFPTRQDIEDYLSENLDGEENEQEFFEAQQFYIAFDFLPEGTDLLALYKDLLGDQIGGYYDPETKEMNVVLLSGNRPGKTLPVLEQITYSHEFTHALQDQYFGLEAFVDEEIAFANPDMAQARLSLVEGDATVVMNEYTVYITEEAPLLVLGQILIQGAASGSLSIPEGTPAILTRELLSPYLDGANFVEALRAEGGWERVNQAYENPPASTEQILHPEKYLEGDMPIEVELAPDENPLGDGWELLFDRPLGEFYLREYLDTQLPPLDVIEAGGGWGGDRYRLYYNAESQQRAWVLRLEWDTPLDAEQFAEVFVKFGDTRFETSADADGCWSNERDAICFAEVDAASLVSYAPTAEQAQRLLQGQLETATALR
jgi:hypothetical protein